MLDPGEEADKLRLYAEQVVEGLFSGDARHAFLTKHLTADFEAASCSHGRKLNIDQFVIDLEGVRKAHNLKLHSQQVDFDRSKRLPMATVWLFTRSDGSVDGITREGVIMSKWRLQADAWQCFYLERYLGEAGISGFAY